MLNWGDLILYIKVDVKLSLQQILSSKEGLMKQDRKHLTYFCVLLLIFAQNYMLGYGVKEVF